jgi:hypothetical protein
VGHRARKPHIYIQSTGRDAGQDGRPSTKPRGFRSRDFRHDLRRLCRARIIALVEHAQANKAPVERLVDRVAAIFVPIVLLPANDAGASASR